ncbi:hypothetical protein EC2726800_1179 [Escherichia coli 2726800]|uniref:Uncharacterized protein n=1 Tax=Escherichia coli M605 TaxID=656417 RepID=F4SWD2_ECOLX|nr:hypothetical protein ECOK1180_5732 [Escherichia coli OK1180]EGI17073.1 conserved hypothetical protein [Escherichia coli M605]EGW90876.1 hypothetical protein EC30301_1084 [Escherichia coli 3030-1]EHW66883.1 hypothetical protein ECDEC10A_1211 [Escherichia coli DEC10A]EIG79248.1 hypothetical protein EC12741_4421 [Escherichia coli 1.2741]EIO77899.1 hypothetical protein ECTW09109_1410 [Escherichia coli TW09109]EIP32157.1 hypothetical protein ECEC4422_1238 [Escherichia coli EC4422]EKH06094.1 hy
MPKKQDFGPVFFMPSRAISRLAKTACVFISNSWNFVNLPLP